MLLTTVFLALVTVHGVRCSWRDGDNGVDRVGGDLPNMPIRSVGSPGDCADACGKNSDCVAWAFGTSGCGGLNTTACWLKNAVMPQSLDPCRVSCFLVVISPAPSHFPRRCFLPCLMLPGIRSEERAPTGPEIQPFTRWLHQTCW